MYQLRNRHLEAATPVHKYPYMATPCWGLKHPPSEVLFYQEKKEKSP
jgi:hypothetical protein